MLMRWLSVFTCALAFLSANARAQCTTTQRCRTQLASLGEHVTNIRAKLVVDSNALYFARSSGIVELPLNGVARNVTTIGGHFTLDAGNLYWVDGVQVRRAPMGAASGTALILASGANAFSDPVVAHGSLFFVVDGNEVRSVPIVGGPIVSLLRMHSPQIDSRDIMDLVTDGTYLFFSTRQSVERLQFAGGRSTLATLPGVVTALAANIGGVYAAISGGPLVMISPAGATTTLVATPGLIARLFLYASTLYWPDIGGHAINAYSLSGSALSKISTGNDVPVAVAVDSTSLYYVTSQGNIVRLTPK
jgi:hypothetical protein